MANLHLKAEAQKIGISGEKFEHVLQLFGDETGIQIIEDAIRQHRGKRSANKQLRTEHEAHDVLARYNAEKSGMTRQQIATITKDFGPDLGTAVLLGGVQLRKEMAVKQAGKTKAAVAYKDTRTPSKPTPAAAKQMMIPVNDDDEEYFRKLAGFNEGAWSWMTRQLSQEQRWELIQSALPAHAQGKVRDRFWGTLKGKS